MNINELRATMGEAFRREGLEERRLFSNGLKVWSLPAQDLIRFFYPQAYRRPWGFVYSGSVGIEIPALRQWLQAHRPEGAGIFHDCFVSYLSINDDVFRHFMVDHRKPIPADRWAHLLKDRLEKVPSTLDGLIAAYRRNNDELGELGHVRERHAWDFLLKWREDPIPSLPVPQMLPDGCII